MTAPLPERAPGFDQPIAVLKHCHDKIRHQLSTLHKLLADLAEHGGTIEAAQAAQAVLKYFNKAAALHHEDEEHDLLPMLQATARGDDAAVLDALVPALLAEHLQMEQAWHGLRQQLEAIASRKAAALSAEAVRQFDAAYQAHMTEEEGVLAPMANRLFSPAQMAQLGAAMQWRRGIGAPAPAGTGAATGDGASGTSGAGAAPDAGARAQVAATVAAAGAASRALADLRTDYSQASLNEADLLDDPVAQFGKWFEQALQAQVNEPNAMSVATVGPDGKPSSRIVLIKQYDARGFTWYTNYHSQKGEQLAGNPHAALLFFWSELERQVRIEGTVVKTTEEESDHYFHSRPLKSRLAAIASAQSAPIADRQAMEARYEAVAASDGEQPARPAHWGGYRLQPDRIEFWQGRRSRFHDRIVFIRQADGSWLRQRLQP
ncbi:MAG: pyridoxamine 5'-phosphate oxidase [Pseudomonadota bacterium]